LTTTFDVNTEDDFITDYSIKIHGECGEHSFDLEQRLFSAHQKINFKVDNPLLWWPKNYGEQNIYDVTLTLFKNGVKCHSVSYKTGIRTAYLRRSSCAGDDGDFCFIVNGKRIFCLGTNWVPTDAFPSRHNNYEMRGLELVKDINCNMLRIWGGNTYPSTDLYDF
jgi:beta-mannosidase